MAASLSIALSACGSDDASTDVAADGGPELPVLDAATAFDGQATTVQGEPFDLGTLAGSDLVVWFWAPW